jgi:hypothetical protein
LDPNHLKRVDEIGASLDAAHLADLTDALGHRPDTDTADDELLALVTTAGPDREEQFVRLLDRRAQRMHLAMAFTNSLMVHHPRLRSLRTDRHPPPTPTTAGPRVPSREPVEPQGVMRPPGSGGI